MTISVDTLSRITSDVCLGIVNPSFVLPDDRYVLIKITELEFDWNFPIIDPLPPDYDLHRNIGKFLIVHKDSLNECDIIEYLEDWLESCFPITSINWEMVG